MVMYRSALGLLCQKNSIGGGGGRVTKVRFKRVCVNKSSNLKERPTH